jgi:Raf kinase inhibitor-like YbhB/YbcL family protein
MRTMFFLLLATVLLVLATGGCGPTPSPESEGTVSLNLVSTAFEHGEPIPVNYSCDGSDISPPLQWDAPPGGTQSFALIVDDPDAPVGTWVHWVAYNLPGESWDLHEAIPPDAELAAGGLHGQNSWKRLGYGGPCPPSGTHRYFFKLYALDTALGLEPGATAEQVRQAMEGHVLAEGELMGTYSRQ